MPDPSAGPSFHAILERAADLLDAIAPRLVTIHGRRRGTSSGFLWRPGLAVTAEEALEADEDVTITRPDGSQVAATLVGRDPSTDIALLRLERFRDRPCADLSTGTRRVVEVACLVALDPAVLLLDEPTAGLSAPEAGQRYCALASPELYQTLTVEFGWTPARHRRWLTRLLETELLEPDAPSP